ncbi:MAG: polysaccharide deacetylase family protein [Anaerolineae bacterium]|nr:polysaccharide deacetylase family protein [Anaerolineae bacterium]
MPWALFLAVVFVLVFAEPVRGRWEVLQTVEPAERAHSLSSETTLLDPTPTPVIPERAQVPILMYHYVSDVPPGADYLRRDLTVTPENFRAQMQYLADAGYHPITLTDLYLCFTQGYPLPDKPVVLTFDDGYRDAYEVVFPMLLDYGFPGTFFVLATPMHQESPDYMTWAQAKEMSDAGMAIEGHGRDHMDLRGRSNDFLVYQILGIQEAIHYHTGRLPRFFAYPSGQYDANTVAVLESAGYWGAVTTEWGEDHTLESRFAMPRLRIRGRDTLESFIYKLED